MPGLGQRSLRVEQALAGCRRLHAEDDMRRRAASSYSGESTVAPGSAEADSGAAA